LEISCYVGFNKKGFDVTILSISDKKLNNIEDFKDKVKLIIKDIKNISAEDVADKDQIYHLASTVDNYAVKEGRPYEDIEINCVGTISLLEACKNFNPAAKIFLASTFFVNGNVDKIPVGPSAPCNPLGLYGATRLAAEHFFHIYHKVFGLNVVIARFTNVFGDYEQGSNKKKAGFNYMINQAVIGEELPHSYISCIYSKFMSKMVNINLLEIGVWKGNSIKFWADCFPDGNITGIDNYLEYDQSVLEIPQKGKNYKILIKDAYDLKFVKSIRKKFDVIIDDGPHTALVRYLECQVV
jgi:fibrillarin-like rRNA methylase